MKSPAYLFSAYPLLFFFAVLFLTVHPLPSYAQNNLIPDYKDESDKIIKIIESDESVFEYLTFFVDKFGHRFSGTESLENSIDWILKEMQKDGFDRVTTQKVMVPHWVRGEESAVLTAPREKDLPMLGLGGSIGTPKQGIEAEVLVVTGFEDLKAKSNLAEGKIVLYDVPFTSYGQTVQYRLNGAIEAAKAGAVASLIRSVGPYSMQTPHTGTSNYQEGVKKIPHAAITLEDASLIHRLSKRGEEVRIKLNMNAKTLPETESRNIIAEIKGSEYPDEIVVMGGHIDSWDVGQGVMDDAGGCFAAWEALRFIKNLGLKPKRTIRVVMWTNEENGLRGGTTYRDSVKVDGTLENHILAIESDSGVFKPEGFGFSGSDRAFEIISEIGKLLKPIGADQITRGGRWCRYWPSNE